MKLIVSTLFLLSFVSQVALADSFYTLQLSAAPAQHKNLTTYLALPKMHSENFGDGKDFIYLGHFDSEQEAKTILQQLHTQQPELKTYQPVIVELFTNKPAAVEKQMAQKQIVQKKFATESPRAPVTNKQETTKPSTPNSSAQTEKNQQQPIYTVALAAFEYEERLRSFIHKYSSNDLYCRQKNNGLYAVYWGIFNSYNHAKQGRDIAEKIPDIKPYIVKFNDNDLSNCNTYTNAAAAIISDSLT